MFEERKKSNLSEHLTGFIGGTLSLTVSALIVKFIGLIYKIPIASLLGDEGMGYFNSAYTIYAFFYLLCTAGVPKAVMILISESKARRRVYEEKRIVRVASVLFLGVGVILSAILIVFAAPLSMLIGNSKAYFTLVAIAPSIIPVAISGVIRGYLTANTKLLEIAVSQIIEGVGKLGIGLLLAMLGVRYNLSLEILSALTVLGVSFGSFIGTMYLLVCSKNRNKGENTGQNVEKMKFSVVAGRIFKISLPITISSAIMSFTNLIDLGLIMRSLVKVGYSENIASMLYGNYTTLAVPMLNLATSIISPVSVAFLPVFTRCFIKSDTDGQTEAERSAIQLTSLIGAPIMFGLIFYAKEILAMLFPSSEVNTGAALLSLIAPSIFFSSLLIILNTLLEAYGKLKSPLISMTVGSIIKIIASYLLITRTDLGILGAPIGTVLSYASGLIVSILIYGKTFGRIIPIFEQSLIPHILAFTAVILSRFVYQSNLLSLPQTPSLMLSILLCALIYLGLSVFVGVIRPKRIKELAKYTNLS